MADPYAGPLVVIYARHFQEEESEPLPGIKEACAWIDESDDCYPIRIQTTDGRLLYERETGGPSLKWHVRAIDAPPLPADSMVKPWTPDPPRKRVKPPTECPDCGAPTVSVETEPIEWVSGGGHVSQYPLGPTTCQCENGHLYGLTGPVFGEVPRTIGFSTEWAGER